MKKAFTLIELLVTIVLFSLLLAVALYSFRFASMDIRSINNTNPKNAINYYLIRSAINSIYPYVEIDKNNSSLTKNIHYFFIGDKTETYFITSKGLFFDNNIVLGHLYFLENQLWYEEGKIFGKGINYKELNKIIFSRKILILDNITNLSLFYLSSDKKVYFEYKNKIPLAISIKFTESKKNREYYFFIGMDSEKRLNTVLQSQEMI